MLLVALASLNSPRRWIRSCKSDEFHYCFQSVMFNTTLDVFFVGNVLLVRVGLLILYHRFRAFCCRSRKSEEKLSEMPCSLAVTI